MFGVEFRDAPGLSPLRIVIPGKASLPGPGLVPVALLELFDAAEFPPLLAAFELIADVPEAAEPEAVFPVEAAPVAALAPGPTPGKVRFGCSEIANCPSASPAGTTTG